MVKTLKDILEELPAGRRKKVERRAKELIQEELTLQALRKELGLTQEAMADRLDMRQGNVSKVEKREDMLISTLRGYVEAMGGTLELVARLPGRGPVVLKGFGD